MLAPLLAGSVVAAASEFSKVLHSPHKSSRLLLSGLGIVVLSLMVGVGAVSFRRFLGATLSRHMAFLTFCEIAAFYAGGIVYMTWDKHHPTYAATMGSFGLLALALLVALWWQSG